MKKILITGANGFLGHHVKAVFEYNNDSRLYTPSSKEMDLMSPTSIKEFFLKCKPDIIIHLAGSVGGIGLNKTEPGRLTYENLMMGLNLIEACRLYTHIEKFVCIGTTCSYAANCPTPFKEEDFIAFNQSGPGMPEITNAGYGLGKRMLYELLRNYNLQYNFPFIYLIPVNLCGPFDHFEDNKSHVIPALIKRLHHAKLNNESQVVVWGTGKPTREFLYAPDCAEAIFRATSFYNDINPLNIGNGKEIAINDLVNKIAIIVGYRGHIVFDSSQPDGQVRRCMDVSKMKHHLGDICNTSIDEALLKTYEWYINNAKI